MGTRRKAKATPLERLVKANTTKLKNLTAKRVKLVTEMKAELGTLDGQIAEVKTLLKQLKK